MKTSEQILYAKFRPVGMEALLTNLGAGLIESDLPSAMACLYAAYDMDPANEDTRITLSAGLDLLHGAEREMIGLLEGINRYQAYFNTGLALLRLHEYQEALQLTNRAISMARAEGAPLGGYLLQRGSIEAHMLRYQDAIASYTDAMECPDVRDSKYYLGMATLARSGLYSQTGQWDLALAGLEDRIGFYSGNNDGRLSKVARWDGRRDLRDKTICIWMEQGLGDQIQYIRLIPWIKRELGPRHITVACSHQLMRLFHAVPGVDRILPDSRDPVVGDYDEIVAVLEFQKYRHEHGIKDVMGYAEGHAPYLKAMFAPNMGWRMPKKGEEFRIAIAWRGNPKHMNDWNRSMYTLKYLDFLAANLSGFDVEWVSAQMYPESDTGYLDGFNHPILKVGNLLGDMHDTVLALDEVDLVLSVDTSIAHLCGASGKRCYVMLPYAPDWRWDNPVPLYGNHLKVFRQKKPGDWYGVMTEIAEELSVELEAKQRESTR